MSGLASPAPGNSPERVNEQPLLRVNNKRWGATLGATHATTQVQRGVRWYPQCETHTRHVHLQYPRQIGIQCKSNIQNNRKTQTPRKAHQEQPGCWPVPVPQGTRCRREATHNTLDTAQCRPAPRPTPHSQLATAPVKTGGYGRCEE